LDFADAVKFHGHACLRLSVSYRVALLAANYFKTEVKMKNFFGSGKWKSSLPKKLKFTLA